MSIRMLIHALAWCISSWILARASASASQSASVVSQPPLNRSTRCASAALKSIAASTCDGSSLPVVQAEPVETAKPALSSWTPSAACAAFRHQRRNGVPQPRRVRADDDRAGQFVQKLPLEILAPDAAQNVFAARNLFFARFQRRQHGDDDGDVFRSGAPAAFLFAAEEQRRDVARVRHFQKAHAARSAEFVRRAAEVIAFAQSFRRHFAEPLHGVGEERHFVLLADGQHLAPRLDDAGFVVRGHDGRRGRGACRPVRPSASPGQSRRRA